MSVDEQAARWAADLAAWAIPQSILDAAPESPWGFPVELFLRSMQDDVVTPSHSIALEAMPDRGSILDVGCGTGAASFALAPPAARVIGVDESADMLNAFASKARVPHVEILGRWPDVTAQVEPADVVVCNHVLFNVAEIVPFVRALTEHARKRVVVEIFDEHPVAWMNPLWRELHQIDRPDRPHAADAFAIIEELNPKAKIMRWEGSAARWEGDIDDVLFSFLRRRLCLPHERDADLRAALARTPPPTHRTTATIWWDVA